MDGRGSGRRLDVDVVTLSFHGAVVDWRSAVEAVVYDTARAHGESPLDRGRSLRRRLEALGSDRNGVAAAFDALAAERGYRWARPGAVSLQRVLGLARPYGDVAPALERLLCEGVPVVVISDTHADVSAVQAALRPLDGAIADVVAAAGSRAALADAVRRAGVPAGRVLHVGAALRQLDAAAGLGIRTAWLNRSGAAPPPGSTFGAELRSLHELCELARGRPALAAG